MGPRQQRATSVAILPFEWGVAILASGAAIALHVVFLTHAGGLWRDEINSLGTARASSSSELWRLEQFESFPILWLLILKLWMGIGGDADAGLRVFGVLGGLALPAAIWFAAWRLRRGVPLVGLALVAVNPEIIRWASTVRAWGLSAALAIVACTLAFDATTARRRSVILAAIAAIASVQSAYQNLVFVAAAGVAALALAAWQRTGTKALTAAVMIAAASAASLVPYAGVFQGRRQWSMLIEGPLGLGEIASHARAVAGASGAIVEISWLALAGAAVIAPLFKRAGLAIYSSVVLAGSFVGLTIFYLWFRISPSPWYFVGLLAVVAVMAETTLLSVYSSRVMRVAACVAALGVLALGFAPALSQLEERQTNLDAIGAQLTDRAREGDLIVVSSWYMAITVDRYYRGPASLASIPPIADHTIHRYDLVKAAMQSTGVIDPLLTRVREALQTGRRVWIVGGLGPAPDAAPLPDLPAPPLPDTGWAAWPYTDRWASQVGWFVRRHAVDARAIDIGEPGGRFEAASLVVLSGWR